MPSLGAVSGGGGSSGLDGIERKINPAEHNLGPFDVDIARQDTEFRSRITPLPRSLYAALDSLKKDHAFLTKGEVFSTAFIEAWVEGKRLNDASPVASRPHPYEFELYLDV